MDMDVYPLHDIAPLRTSGFAIIFGLETVDRINNGIMMSRNGSALMNIFNAAQHDVFDNSWTAHSTTLLTELCYRLRYVPYEVLVVDKKAFSPSDWMADNMEHLFNELGDTPKEESNMTVPETMEEIQELWDSRGEREAWEDDYSGYLLHAFDGPDGHWSDQVDFEYVLRRKSNLARAVYPAIKHAIEHGFIEQSEEAEGENEELEVVP